MHHELVTKRNILKENELDFRLLPIGPRGGAENLLFFTSSSIFCTKVGIHDSYMDNISDLLPKLRI